VSREEEIKELERVLRAHAMGLRKAKLRLRVLRKEVAAGAAGADEGR